MGTLHAYKAIFYSMGAVAFGNTSPSDLMRMMTRHGVRLPSNDADGKRHRGRSAKYRESFRRGARLGLRSKYAPNADSPFYTLPIRLRAALR